MIVNLDIWELGYLLDTCLRGSHLRSGTIDRFVDEFFDKLTEQERYNLYEWSLRLTYSYYGEFRPSSACCGADIKFMQRYDPENQYIVTSEFEGKTEQHRAYKQEGSKHYWLDSTRFIEDRYIVKAEKFMPPVERTDFERTFKYRRH